MQDPIAIKQTVKEKYSEIALQQDGSCCGGSNCSGETIEFIGEKYDKLAGYNPEADLGLGCGLPTQYAKLAEGQSVLDLGAGAGNDCFIARSIVGETGKVIGVDMSEAMVTLAKKNAATMGFDNMDFRLGEIEDLPLADNQVDVVVSNCVLNLVPNKQKAFAETFRVLKPGGHFSISDIVIRGQLPKELQEKAELYVGCVSGAIDKDEYLQIIKDAGFEQIEVQKLRKIELPEAILAQYFHADEIAQAREIGIFSVTVYGKKAEDDTCCEPGCCG